MVLAGKKKNAQLQQELAAQLGPGPMRFGPVSQECAVHLEAEARGLSRENIVAFARIKVTWETEYEKAAKKKRFTNNHILRIAIFCEFDLRRATNLMRRSTGRLFELSAIDMEEQLRSKTLFPCPGLKTRGGSNVFYMRPSRYSPKETTVSQVIDNLIFVMDKIVKKDPTRGISFLANMEGWTMSNFSTEYCRRFMNVLQGRDFPAKVDLFLILNPPSWFGKIGAIMKPMLSEAFRERVHMIQEEELAPFMLPNYEKYLPDEVRGGTADTNALVQDFALFHKHLELAINPGRGISRSLRVGLPISKDKVSKEKVDKVDHQISWLRKRRGHSLGNASDASSTCSMSETQS